MASAGKDNVKKLILPYYAKFLVDNEYELKNIAAQNLRIIVKFLESDDIINKIVPIIKSIVSDEHAYVRGKILLLIFKLHWHRLSYRLPQF